MKILIKSVMLLACVGMAFCFSGCDLRQKERMSIPINPAAELKKAYELISWIKSQDKMTELQRKQMFGKLKGQMVIVVGEVREIGKTTFGSKTFVSFTVGKISTFEKANIQFNIPDSLTSTVIGWQKGETHVMRGCIKEIGDLVDDVVCDKAEILDKSETLNAYLNSLKATE